jgi:hypothetical protein
MNETIKPAQMREKMPIVSAFIDQMIAEFGRDGIVTSMKVGIAGSAPTFWATEAGYEIGMKREAKHD